MLKLFKPRVEAPLEIDPKWRIVSVGGNNRCINIKNGQVLPNCVGYAWGRWTELLNSPDHELSRGNAENWWGKQDGYSRGQKPLLGAIACWRKGAAGVAKDGAGHVSVVEKILEDGTIVTSNSAWLGSRFYMRTIPAPYNIGTSFTFQGFIYPPIEFAESQAVINAFTKEFAKEVLAGKWGNGTDRKARLTAAGWDPILVQKYVNELVAEKKLKVVKTYEVLAQEVLDGKWGNGAFRVLRLKMAGYNASKVQDKVNQLLAIKKDKKPIDVITREVIAGKWGNGASRKAALIKAGYDYAAIQRRVNQLLR